MRFSFSISIVTILLFGCSTELSEDEQHLIGLLFLQESLPMKIDTHQTLTDVSVNKNGDWVYKYVIDFNALKKIYSATHGNIEDKRYIELRKQSDYVESLKIYQKSPEMIRIRNKNIKLIYQYYDLNGKHLYTNKVPSSDMANIISLNTKETVSNKSKLDINAEIDRDNFSTYSQKKYVTHQVVPNNVPAKTLGINNKVKPEDKLGRDLIREVNPIDGKMRPSRANLAQEALQRRLIENDNRYTQTQIRQKRIEDNKNDTIQAILDSLNCGGNHKGINVYGWSNVEKARALIGNTTSVKDLSIKQRNILSAWRTYNLKAIPTYKGVYRNGYKVGNQDQLAKPRPDDDRFNYRGQNID